MTHAVHRWDEIDLVKITEMMSQKVVSGAHQMLAQTYLKQGALVPLHAHSSEQMTYVLQGAVRFVVAGEETIVREGEVLHIPSNAPHQAEVLEDTFQLDVFSPTSTLALYRVDPGSLVRRAGCSESRSFSTNPET